LWREWRGFLLFVVVMVVFRSAVADWNQVPTGSMKPSILIGDRIVVDKLAYDLRSVHARAARALGTTGTR
jgi:signal peptidase I